MPDQPGAAWTRPSTGSRDRRQNESNQPLAALFYPGHTAVIRFVKIKTIVQRKSRHWMHSMNGRPPFRPDRGPLLWRDP